MSRSRSPLCGLLLCVSATAMAAPLTYDIDPDHTHVVSEADHFGGLSVWRGLFSGATGKVVLDKTAGTGSVDVTMDLATAYFGVPLLDQVVKGPEFFDVGKYPQAHFTGSLGGFTGGAPTTLTGELTLHGVAKPLTLKVLSFKCAQHPLYKREFCGADVYGVLQRDEYGLSSGKDYGFKMDVGLRIQVEAIVEPAK